MAVIAPVIAIDGTFASGKGTLAKALAEHYGLAYLDTGKLYRAVGHAVVQAGHDPSHAEAAGQAAQALDVKTLNDPILKSGDVAVAASKVAVHPNASQSPDDADLRTGFGIRRNIRHQASVARPITI